MGHLSPKLLLFSVAFLSLVPVTSGADRINRLDRAWKRYRNEQFGYCVSYPSRWARGEAFDGAGIWVEAGVKKHSMPVGEIDIRALKDGLDGKAQTAEAGLVEDVAAHLNGLKKFERAQQVEVLERREMKVLDSPALFIKDRYRDPLDQRLWIDEVIFAARKNVIYRLELECRGDQLARFEPLFEQFAASFQFECAASR